MISTLDTSAEKSECIICGQRKPEGISIFGQLICHECEREIVASEVGDERYPFYVEQMKKIWLAAFS